MPKVFPEELWWYIWYTGHKCQEPLAMGKWKLTKSISEWFECSNRAESIKYAFHLFGQKFKKKLAGFQRQIAKFKPKFYSDKSSTLTFCCSDLLSLLQAFTSELFIKSVVYDRWIGLTYYYYPPLWNPLSLMHRNHVCQVLRKRQWI